MAEVSIPADERLVGGSVTVHVHAPPERVYALVADITRMGEWSPECVRCRWVKGATGPVVGARFRAVNRRGFFRWSNTPEVIAADPGQEFAFRRKAPGFPASFGGSGWKPRTTVAPSSRKHGNPPGRCQDSNCG